eukprot:jgi/Bigna1/70956/fgenesh1_pg.14_\
MFVPFSLSPMIITSKTSLTKLTKESVRVPAIPIPLAKSNDARVRARSRTVQRGERRAIGTHVEGAAKNLRCFLVLGTSPILERIPDLVARIRRHEIREASPDHFQEKCISRLLHATSDNGAQGGFTPKGFGPCHARNPIQTSSEAPQKTSGRVRRSRIVQKGVQKSGFSREKIEGKNFGCRGKGPLCVLAQKNMLRGRVNSNSITSRSSTPKFAKLNVSAPKRCFFFVVLTLVSFRCVAPSGLHGADAAINEAGCDARRAAPELLGIGRTSKTCGHDGAHWHTLCVPSARARKHSQLPTLMHTRHLIIKLKLDTSRRRARCMIP